MVSHCKKIAISLPEELLERMERERTARSESRSAFIRRAIELLFVRQSHTERVAEYVAGYQRHPEGEEEALSETVAGEVFGEEPWE